MIAALMGIWVLALIAIAIRWPQYLVPTAIVCSVFEGVAVVNVGGLGISPYFFTLALIATRCCLVRVEDSSFLGESPDVRRILSAAFAFLLVGVGSALVLPVIFAGWPVLSPRLSADAQAPLRFSTSNMGQASYLLMNVMFLWYTSQVCRTNQMTQSIKKAFMLSGTIVVVLAVYQLIAVTTGLPFPDSFLYSNDSLVMQNGTAILGMPRLCSTFSEPSSLAVFLIPFSAFLMASLDAAKSSWRVAVLLLTSIAILVLSTSSTAYLGLAGLLIWALAKYIFLPIATGRGNWRVACVVIVLLAGGIVAFATNDALRDVVQATVFDKSDSASFEERSQSNAFSITLAENTFGLGVGLGSNRASSFFPSLVSTTGVFGVGLFTLLIVFLVSDIGNRFPIAHHHRPMTIALFAMLGAKLISSPDLATPAMWSIMATIVAVRSSAITRSESVDDRKSDRILQAQHFIRRSVLGNGARA